MRVVAELCSAALTGEHECYTFYIVMVRKFVLLLTYIVLVGLAYLLSIWLPNTTTENVFQSVLILTVLYGVFAVGLEEVVIRKVGDTKTRYSLRKTVSLIMMVLVCAAWLRVWVPNPEALLVAYGVIAAGLAVALQDVVKNLAGSITIFITGMYRVGNRIEVNDTVGDVIDIGLFNTTLLEVRGWLKADQATGRITTIPNGVVLTKSVKNYTKLHKYLWDELSLEVTAESNWGEAMRLIGEIGEEHTKDFITEAGQSLTRLERYYYVEGHVLKPNVYIAPSENGYAITLRYVVDAWQRRSTNSEIWGHILRVCEERDDIMIAPKTIASLAYPQAQR